MEPGAILQRLALEHVGHGHGIDRADPERDQREHARADAEDRQFLAAEMARKQQQVDVEEEVAGNDQRHPGHGEAPPAPPARAAPRPRPARWPRHRATRSTATAPPPRRHSRARAPRAACRSCRPRRARSSPRQSRRSPAAAETACRRRSRQTAASARPASRRKRTPWPSRRRGSPPAPSATRAPAPGSPNMSGHRIAAPASNSRPVSAMCP